MYMYLLVTVKRAIIGYPLNFLFSRRCGGGGQY